MKKKSSVERKSPRPKKAASGALAVGAGSALICPMCEAHGAGPCEECDRLNRKPRRKSKRGAVIDCAKLKTALDVAIAFHRENTNDPHNIGNAVLCALTEVRTALLHSLR